jgi:hypothetical protein
MHPLVAALVAVALPAVVFLGGARLMGRLSGAERMARYREVGEAPLNVRWRGYDAEDAARVWRLLDAPAPAGGRYLDMERRFLRLDLAFPLCYGAALLAGMWLAWRADGRGPMLPWLALPVVVNVLADWTENSLQLQQLARFEAGRLLDPGAVRVASAATIVKLVAFTGTSVLVLLLALAALVPIPRR